MELSSRTSEERKDSMEANMRITINTERIEFVRELIQRNMHPNPLSKRRGLSLHVLAHFGCKGGLKGVKWEV